MRKHYINLTNGIEKLEEIVSLNEPYSFLRICSTTIECKNWVKLFTDLDHDFLMHLVLGFECNVYDFGTNRVMSKTCYVGIPLIRYVLTRFYLDKETDEFRIGRNGNVTKENYSKYFSQIYEYLFMYDRGKEGKLFLKTKLAYYKKFLNTDVINLNAISESTSNDGNCDYYRHLLIINLKK